MRSLKMKRPIAHRAGFALVEMVTLIVVVSMLLSLSAIVLNQAYRVHANTLSTLQNVQQLNFWFDRFRADAHGATGVATEDGLTFQVEQSTIGYVLEDARLVRRMRSGEQVLSEERWHIPPVARAGWQVESSGRFPLVSLRLEFVQRRRNGNPSSGWLASDRKFPRLHNRITPRTATKRTATKRTATKRTATKRTATRQTRLRRWKETGVHPRMPIGSPVENRVRQRGAIVVCVLVVLLIVGMLAAQTIQTSLLMRRGDAERSQLRQARELVELGRLALPQAARDVPVARPSLASGKS